jgi:zinc transport system substrate-binding protein
MNIQRLIAVVGIITLLSLVAVFAVTRMTKQDTTTKLTVSASFYPLAHFTERIGGDLVEVKSITPPGTEPHDFEPTAKDIADLQTSSLLLFNGSGLDPWAERIAPELQQNGVMTLRMSDTVALREGDDHGDEEGHEEDADEQESSESATDPHFWLDPVVAQQQVTVIADALGQLDPEHDSVYQQNAASYIAQLQSLDADYRTGLATCATNEIITSHGAFGYLAARYNLTVHAIAGLSPDQEPSAQQLADLAELAREEHITHIFFETLTSPRLAQTLAQEIGAEVLVFNPLEGLTLDEIAQGNTYISVMKDNLTQLQIALECK